MANIGVYVNDELISKVDALLAFYGFHSRSELIKNLLKEWIKNVESADTLKSKS